MNQGLHPWKRLRISFLWDHGTNVDPEVSESYFTRTHQPLVGVLMRNLVQGLTLGFESPDQMFRSMSTLLN
jgi:hypothetical protein